MKGLNRLVMKSELPPVTHDHAQLMRVHSHRRDTGICVAHSLTCDLHRRCLPRRYDALSTANADELKTMTGKEVLERGPVVHQSDGQRDEDRSLEDLQAR